MPRASPDRDLSLVVTKYPDPAWTAIAAASVGEPSGDAREPDEHVLVSEGGAPLLRLDVFYPEDEYRVRTEADLWGEWVVVGFAARVVLFCPRDGRRREIALSDVRPPDSLDYFCAIDSCEQALLVCSGRRVFRIGDDGEVLWKSGEVGLDGVFARVSCEDGRVHGRGEWDPPGGWIDFTLSLATGEPVSVGSAT